MKPIALLWGVAANLWISTSISAIQEIAGPLLKPTGEWPVGRVSLEVEDRSRAMPDGGHPRRLMVHVWYPANSAAATNLPYIEGLNDAKSLFTDDEFTALNTVRTHASAEPPASVSSSRFPVLLFAHGDQMNAFLYSNLNEELASHGYVVVGVDSPGAALFVRYAERTVAPYAELSLPSAGAARSRYLRSRIAERAADLRVVHGQLRTLKLRGRWLGDFASERVGAFGHSSGGLVAVLLCQEQPLLDACLNMDGRLNAAPFVTEAGILAPSRPLMYLTKPFRPLSEAELQAEHLTRDQASRVQEEALARDQRLLADAGPPAYRALLRNADHGHFSDEPLLRDSSDARSLSLMRSIRGVIVEFFDTTLKDGDRRLLRSRSSDGLELEVMATPRPIAEPGGPANGSQPIRAETNRTSSAAGSRR